MINVIGIDDNKFPSFAENIPVGQAFIGTVSLDRRGLWLRIFEGVILLSEPTGSHTYGKNVCCKVERYVDINITVGG